MIGAGASVPIRVFITDDGDVVGDQPLEPVAGVVGDGGDGFVDEVDDLGDAQREKKHVSLVWMRSSELVVRPLHFVDELSFYRVYIVHRTVVEDRLLSFPVDPHLESLHHLYVAPESHRRRRFRLPQQLNFIIKR